MAEAMVARSENLPENMPGSMTENIPEKISPEFCFHCRKVTDVQACSDCEFSQYCSEECQKIEHGKQHKDLREACQRMVEMRKALNLCDKKLKNHGIDALDPHQLLICGPKEVATPFRDSPFFVIDKFLMAVSYDSPFSIWRTILDGRKCLEDYQPWSLHLR